VGGRRRGTQQRRERGHARRFDVQEIADALGWADFGQDDFEEIMSTHYGRMVVVDDRVLMFANPEDAAECIGFDLQPVTEA
jgi:propane monooxygenase coupling protein